MTICTEYTDRVGNVATISQDKPFSGSFNLTITAPTKAGPHIVTFRGTYTARAGAVRAMKRHMDGPRRTSPDAPTI